MILKNRYVKIEINTKKIKKDLYELYKDIVTLAVIIIFIASPIVIYISIQDNKKLATECNLAKNGTCSYYELKQYSINNNYFIYLHDLINGELDKDFNYYN